MTSKAYELLIKEVKPRIKSYEREDCDPDRNAKATIEFSCSNEYREKLQEFMRNETTAKIIAEENGVIRFEVVVDDHEFLEKIIADFF